MAQSLLELRRNKENMLDKFRDQVKSQSSKIVYDKDDTRFWKLAKDKVGNGYAVIRFLAPPKGEEFPYAKYMDVAFKGEKTGRWYINKSRESLGQPDPVAEMRKSFYRKGDKAMGSLLKTRTNYVSNILVVKDPANPENEGKVFLFRYGTKIFDKITNACSPEFDYDEAVNVWDFDEGANFKLKVRTISDGKAKFPSYDNSEFDRPSPVAKTDEEIEKIWNSQYSLKEFTDESKYKSYAELEAQLNQVLGLVGSGASAPVVKTEEESMETDLGVDADSDDDFMKNLEKDLEDLDIR